MSSPQAYASVAAGRYPVRAHGLPLDDGSWWGGGEDHPTARDPAFAMLRDVLYSAANRGTGRAAALPIPTFGKTGTTSDYRDALFVGFAGDLVVGVWIGNDDNRPLPGTAGGGLPARIWHAFMVEALGDAARAGPPVPLREADRAPEKNIAGNATEPVPVPGGEAPSAPPPGPPPEIIAPPPPAPKEEPAPDA